MAVSLFGNLEVELVDGHRVLGSVLGSSIQSCKSKMQPSFQHCLTNLLLMQKNLPKIYTTL